MIQQDGPIPPNTFSFGGVAYSLRSALVWRLLHHVWSKPGRQVSVDSLAEAVWGDATHSVSYLAVASLRRNANRFFKAHTLPFMMRTSQDTVFVVSRPLNKDINDE